MSRSGSDDLGDLVSLFKAASWPHTGNNNKATVSITEFYLEVDNYQTEALGEPLGLLIIFAASTHSLSYKSCHVYYDNKGIATHTKDCCHSPLTKTQIQVDVVGLIKQYIRDLSFDVRMSKCLDT